MTKGAVLSMRGTIEFGRLEIIYLIVYDFALDLIFGVGLAIIGIVMRF